MRYIILFVMVLMTGCSTKYQSEGFKGGFSETQIDNDVFEVSFRGNGFTSTKDAEDFALLRCAEIAKKNGFSHFMIIDRKNVTTRSTMTTPVQSYTTANAYAVGNYAYGSATTTTHGGQTIEFIKPRSSNIIKCFREKPVLNALIYDASLVCASIGARHGVKCD